MTLTSGSTSAINLFRAMRPNQWTKNGVILAAFIFGWWDKSQDVDLTASMLKIIPAVFLFCLASSSIYLINDVRDIESDKVHPTKRYRPIAAGLVSIHAALTAAAILLVFVLASSWMLSPPFFLVVSGYIVLQIVYSLF